LCGCKSPSQGAMGSPGFSRFLTSFACQKRGVARNRYDRFSIPERSVPLRFFFRSFSSRLGASR
jgi:hypothetical protein